MRKPEFLTGNMLKIIAAVSMVVDHVGLVIFPGVQIFRIIGRIAFPIFCYMIAEGCIYTKNRLKYLLSILAVGVFCQGVYLVSGAGNSLYFNTLFTLAIAVALIYLLDWASLRPGALKVVGFLVFIIGVAAAFVLMELLPTWVPGSGFSIDYGFYGVILPVLIYIPNISVRAKAQRSAASDNFTSDPACWISFDQRGRLLPGAENADLLYGATKILKLVLMAVGLVLLSIRWKDPQPWCLIDILIIFFYNGKRGTRRMKYFFYIFYPVHLGVIYLIGILVSMLK